MKKLKRKPRFKNEQQEANFWATHDTTEYINWNKAKRTIFANLKPSSRAIPLKLPNWLLDRLKFLANKYSTSYQDLIRSFLAKEVIESLKEKSITKQKPDSL